MHLSKPFALLALLSSIFVMTTGEIANADSDPGTVRQLYGGGDYGGYESYGRLAYKKFVSSDGGFGGRYGVWSHGGYCDCKPKVRRKYKDKSTWYIRNKHNYYAKRRLFGGYGYGSSCHCPLVHSDYDDYSKWKIHNEYNYYGYHHKNLPRHGGMTKAHAKRHYGGGRGNY